MGVAGSRPEKPALPSMQVEVPKGRGDFLRRFQRFVLGKSSQVRQQRPATSRKPVRSPVSMIVPASLFMTAAGGRTTASISLLMSMGCSGMVGVIDLFMKINLLHKATTINAFQPGATPSFWG